MILPYRSLLLVPGVLTLVGCAMFGSSPSVPIEARVVPLHAGIEMEPRTEGSRFVYLWHVHDYDGTNHTLTWEVARGQQTEGLSRFNLCLREKTKVSGSVPPQLMQAVKACAKTALRGAYEGIEPGESEYKVVVVTRAATSHIGAGALSVAPALGAQMKVMSRGPADNRIFADVASCLNTAQAEHSFADCGEQLWQCKSAHPMLHQFDDCLRSRAYSVETVGAGT
jgi:hypothetical protein